MTIIGIAATRAIVAATLAYAVLPSRAFVALATILDAAAGVAMGTDTVRRSRPRASLVVLELLVRTLLLGWEFGDVFHGGTMAFVSGYGWFLGRVGILLVWFAPIALARVAVLPLVEPWRAETLHVEERARQTWLATGVTLPVTVVCVARLVRSAWVTNAGVVAALVGVGLACIGVREGLRRRRWLGSVRRGEIATHRIAPIDESVRPLPALDEEPDSVLIATAALPSFRSPQEAVARVRTHGFSPQTRRLAAFVFFAALLTIGFDAACWNGSGWIPLRHEYGDRLERPQYLPDERLVRWPVQLHTISMVNWEIGNARIEPHHAWFARVSATEHPIILAMNVPDGTCARPGVVQRRHWLPGTSAHSLDERARIVDPVKRDGRLIYTWRREDGHLVRADVALDGASATCTVDPPPVDDGGAVPMTKVERVVLGRALSCAVADHQLACWGRIVAPSMQGTLAQALPEVLVKRPVDVVTGDEFVCHSERAGVVHCWGSNVPASSDPGGRRFFAGGSVLAVVDANERLRIAPTTSSMKLPFDASELATVHSVALADDRACALRADWTLRCWGSKAPRLDGEKWVSEIALGASLACLRRALDNSVWCAAGDGPLTKIEGLPPTTALAVGDAHACALDRDDGVWCWGSNGSGAVGDGTTTDRPRPVRVLTDAAAIATGGKHTCAIGHDTKLRCWGSNSDGQLGDGTFVDRHTPTEVVW